MLGLFLLYFIGKYYYDLAKLYVKNAWIFAIVGIAAYYAGTIIAGIVIALFYLYVFETSIESISDIFLTLMAIPFGILTCWGLYAFLKHQWTKRKDSNDQNILDSDFKE